MKHAERLLAQAEKNAKYLTGETSGPMYLASLVGGLTATVNDLSRKLADYATPSAGSMNECDYGDLVIHFDYQPEEKSTWDEPGCPAEVDICAVYANGLDILEYISQKDLELMIDAALEAMGEAKYQAQYDRAEHIAQSRRDDDLMAQLGSQA